MKPALGMGAIAVLAVLLLASSLVSVPRRPADLPGVDSPRPATDCPAIASNASLASLVDQHYPNSTLLPNRSVAEAYVLSIWEAVCSSSTFEAADSQAGVAFADSVQVLDKNRTASGEIVGSLFAEFQLTWNSSCPSGSGTYPAAFGCVYSDAWSGNLSTQALTGPSETIVSQRLTQCDTPQQNLTDAQSVAEFYPNPALQPNLSVAEQRVQAISGEVCASESYYQLLVGHPGAANGGISVWTGSAAPNSTSGDALFAQWTLGWNAACSEGPNCYYAEQWTANLATGTSAGPSLTVNPPAGGPPGVKNGSPSPAPDRGAANPWTGGAGLVLGVGIAVGAGVAAAAMIRRRNRAG